jgi:hypothetical protein
MRVILNGLFGRGERTGEGMGAGIGKGMRCRVFTGGPGFRCAASGLRGWEGSGGDGRSGSHTVEGASLFHPTEDELVTFLSWPLPSRARAHIALACLAPPLQGAPSLVGEGRSSGAEHAQRNPALAPTLLRFKCALVSRKGEREIALPHRGEGAERRAARVRGE